MEVILNRKITLLLLLLSLFFLFNSPSFWKAMYPVFYKNEVTESAETHQVDPFLIYAIIQIESNFKDDRVSNKGAIGLMQLMPDTAAWIVEQSHLPYSTLNQLNLPKTNIEMGAWYISFLEKKFHHNHYAVIAAYNAGPGNVEKWLNDNIWDGTYRNLGQIPFGETRHYVQRVLYFYAKYQDIYE